MGDVTKKFERLRKETSKKYSIEEEGANLSGLSEEAPVWEQSILLMLQEVKNESDEKKEETETRQRKNKMMLTLEKGIIKNGNHDSLSASTAGKQSIAASVREYTKQTDSDDDEDSIGRNEFDTSDNDDDSNNNDNPTNKKRRKGLDDSGSTGVSSLNTQNSQGGSKNISVKSFDEMFSDMMEKEDRREIEREKRERGREKAEEEIRKEEQRIRREELEIRKLEAENARARLAADAARAIAEQARFDKMLERIRDAGDPFQLP